MANKIRKNDDVLVIAGKHKGQTGKVISVDNKKGLIVVDKINVVKKHNKPTQNNSDGSITEKEMPIHISNVAFKEKTKDKNGKHSKIGFRIDQHGKKIRFSKKTGKDV